MKSILLLLSFFVYQAAFAQSDLRFGIEFGIGRSALPYTHDTLAQWHMSGRTSLNCMLFARGDLSRRIILESGIRYNLYGNDVDFDFAGDAPTSGSFRISHHQISLPLRFKYTPTASNVFLQVGPQMGYMASSHLHSDELGAEKTENINEQIHRLNVSLSAGIGYFFKTGKHEITVHALYDQGFLPIGKKEMWVSSWKTRDLSLQAGFSL